MGSNAMLSCLRTRHSIKNPARATIPRACIMAFIPYGLLVLALIVVTAFLYPSGSVLLSCYFLYLLYAAWWTHRLFKLNP
jgi:hypothetical protein